MEKSSNWYAPFQVKEHMVLAPLVRNPSFIDTKESFDAAFTDQVGFVISSNITDCTFGFKTRCMFGYHS